MKLSFRFLHTADWQIGKPFGNVPGDAGADLRRQRIATVRKLAEYAAAQQLDAVLVAGDAFDSSEVEDRTIHQMLSALSPFDGPWVFLPGNHDAALVHSVWSRLRQLGPGPNIIIADAPEPIPLAHGKVVVLPAPLRRRRETSDLTGWFDGFVTAPGAMRIGLAHGTVANRLPAGTEAANEIAEDRAVSARLDYLALGDWHGTLEVAERTWYSGTPETDRHRANQSGHALLVEIAESGAALNVVPVPTTAYRWQRLEVGIVDGRCDAVLAALEGVAANPQQAVVSLLLSGAISLAERYRLEEALDSWSARLHHLVVDNSALHEEPTAEDLEVLADSGILRTAVDKLQNMAGDPGCADRDAASVALRMLYLDHMRTGGAR